MKIRLTKLKESENPTHPNNRRVGEITIGNIEKFPIVGERLFIHKSFASFFETSKIEEIIDENTFRTMNSIYKIEILD